MSEAYDEFLGNLEEDERKAQLEVREELARLLADAYWEGSERTTGRTLSADERWAMWMNMAKRAITFLLYQGPDGSRRLAAAEASLIAIDSCLTARRLRDANNPTRMSVAFDLIEIIVRNYKEGFVKEANDHAKKHLPDGPSRLREVHDDSEDRPS